MFVAHIGGMDCLARGLRAAVRAKEDGVLDKFIKDRYKSFDGGLGKSVEAGKCTLEEAAAHALKCGEPKLASGKQEYL